jgi:hypothetical protein
MTWRAALLGVSLVLLSVLLIPVAEGALRLQGAAAWIAVAGLLTVIGGGFAIYGAILNNAEQARMMIGAEETFCQLTIYIDRDGPGWFLSTLHYGPGNAIYDVQVYIVEVEEDGTPMHERDLVTVGTMISVTWPRTLFPLGQPDELTKHGRPRYFSAQMTQRNGVTTQEVVVYPKAKGFIEFGFLELKFNGKPYEPSDKMLLKNISRLIRIPDDEITRIMRLRAERTERVRRRLEDPTLDLTLPREKRGQAK